MSKSRREFLTTVLGMASVVQASEQQPDNPPSGAPPAFGTSPAVGPEVSPGTFAEAEKLVQVHLTSRRALPKQQVTGAIPWRLFMNGARVRERFHLIRQSRQERGGIRLLSDPEPTVISNSIARAPWT